MHTAEHLLFLAASRMYDGGGHDGGTGIRGGVVFCGEDQQSFLRRLKEGSSGVSVH